MKINEFRANEVHGFLNYDISFYTDVTFLIGINGSGKTSALKLILGMISPSYLYLNQIDFKYASLKCSSTNDEKDILIEVYRTSSSFILNVEVVGGELISSNISRTNKENVKDINIDEAMLNEQSIKEEFESCEFTKKIRSLSTPKFLGLDRRIYEGRNIDFRERNNRILNTKLQRKSLAGNFVSLAIDASLKDVQIMIFDFFRKIAFEQPKKSEDFKKKIFQLSFQYIQSSDLSQIPENKTELLEKMEQVKEAIVDLDIKFLDNDVEEFFKRMISLIDESNNRRKGLSDNKERNIENLIQWINNSSQLNRIYEIINFSKTYKLEIAQLKEPIFKLEEIVNNFFKEGRKRLTISDEGVLKIIYENNLGSDSIFDLSSGEKQILIMIAHLIFDEESKSSEIFIIDEPELSLHIAWQKIFVDSIISASPSTQFILATHSPSIVSKESRRQNCEDLNKLNY